MTDKELLELAAKAAGIELAHMPHTHSKENGVVTKGPGFWSPLTDDGDALRLAVKLGMNIDIKQFEAVAYYAVGKFVRESATMGYSLEEATRRVIVRAAAEIGKTL